MNSVKRFQELWTVPLLLTMTGKIWDKNFEIFQPWGIYCKYKLVIIQGWSSVQDDLVEGESAEGPHPLQLRDKGPGEADRTGMQPQGVHDHQVQWAHSGSVWESHPVFKQNKYIWLKWAMWLTSFIWVLTCLGERRFLPAALRDWDVPSDIPDIENIILGFTFSFDGVFFLQGSKTKEQRIDSGEESHDALEEVFSKIQTVTGEDNLDLLVTRFIQG